MIADLDANGYSVMVMWTIDSLGWDGLSADEINERVMSRMEPGAIVLLHVGAASQDAAALPEMIARLRAEGYRFVTIPGDGRPLAAKPRPVRAIMAVPGHLFAGRDA